MSTMGCIAVNAGDRRLSDEAVRCLLQHEHHTHGRSNLVIYISWTDHRTNEWVLSRLEVEKSLLARIRKLKLSYYGHIVRKANCLEKDIIQGCVPGSRGRGDQGDDGRRISVTGRDFGSTMQQDPRKTGTIGERSYVPPTLQL